MGGGGEIGTMASISTLTGTTMVRLPPLNRLHTHLLLYHKLPTTMNRIIPAPMVLTAITPVFDRRGGVDVGPGVGANVSVKRGAVTVAVENQSFKQQKG